MALELTVDKLLEMRGKPVYDRAGEKIGSIEDVYIDDETREPEWIGLGTGFLGMKHAIVPLVEASLREDGIAVPYDKDKVKDAPDAGGEDISAEKEAELARYYAIGTAQPTLGQTRGTGAGVGEQTTTSPRDREGTLTGAEEEFRGGRREIPAGRVTIHKYVQTEPVTEDAEPRRDTAQVEGETIDRPVGPGEDPGEDG